MAKAFYGILAAAMGVGVCIGVSGFNPMSALYWSAVINAVIAVPVMVGVMIASSSPKVVGPLKLGLGWRLLGWAATLAMAAASVAMLVAAVA